MRFTNPHNPSATELREGAYEHDAQEPVQDFDLILSWAGHASSYIEFASDPACPEQDYFLSLLDLIVGDAVRTRFRNQAEHDVRAFIARADGTRSAPVRTWQARSRALLRAPATFGYEDWCAGGVARRDAG